MRDWIPERDPEGNEPRHLHPLVNFAHRRVLEIGCGDGRLTRRYADATAQVAAIDLDSARLAAALVTGVPASTHVNFMQADACALPFPAERFDVTLLAWSL